MGNPGAVLFSSLLIGLIFSVELSASEFKNSYNWKEVDFTFPNATARDNLINSKAFIPAHLEAHGFDAWKNKVFVTFPRLMPGVPATLAYINLDDKSQGAAPKLIPYPDWDSQRYDRDDKGQRLISVFKVSVDPCDRLWLIDTGKDEPKAKRVDLRPPRLIVFDLKTDKIIHEYTFKNAETPSSFVVDVTKDKCDSAFVYAAYPEYFVVYDFKKQESWLQKQEKQSLQQVDFNPVFLSLSAPNADGSRTLYVRSPSSFAPFSVSTKALQNKEEKSHKVTAYPGVATLDAKTGVLFFPGTSSSSSSSRDELKCWNTVKHASAPDTRGSIPVIGEAEKKGAYNSITDLKVDGKGKIWILRNRKPASPGFTGDSLFISSSSVDDAIKGTPCAA